MKIHKSNSGFTLTEIMVAIVIIGIFGVSFTFIQTSSWGQSIFATRTLVAGHMIEKDIEGMRNTVAMSPTTNFPPTNATYTHSGVTLDRQIQSAKDPKGVVLTNVKKVILTATWRAANSKFDTVKVETYLSKFF